MRPASRPLNEVRRQIFAQTNDGQLAPYTSWSDYGQHLKHPESLINFVAAYGTHPTILTDAGPDKTLGTGDDGPPTLQSRRDAARAIVDPLPTDVQPADAADFMFGTGAWSDDANGRTTTGLDDVDLWVGGLAEVTNLFGGMLGSTFNYVFQTQLEKLQDGDRLYYLARTPGMNLRTQLEGNSFSEMIQRNTTGTDSLKADAFGTADCKFQLGNITTPYSALAPTAVPGFPAGTTLSMTQTPALTPLTGAGSVNDDPSTTDCDENQLLLEKPDGTIQYRSTNKIDPAGINGQSVYNGTDGNDKVFGGNDNDTFWGGLGNDRIEGNGGDDIALGGEGDDIITDLDGADVPKGGPGNDAVDAGPRRRHPDGQRRERLHQRRCQRQRVVRRTRQRLRDRRSGRRHRLRGRWRRLARGWHGAGPAPGRPRGAVLRRPGREGTRQRHLRRTDRVRTTTTPRVATTSWRRTPRSTATPVPEGSTGPSTSTTRWAATTTSRSTSSLGGLPLPIVVNRDRWQETEADSGSNFNDVIRGDALERIVGGFGFTGCDALDPAGVARITGLGDYVTTFPTSLADVKAVAAAGDCPLTGAPASATNPVTGDTSQGGVWAEGNILLGGGGSDVIEGRENQDIIDGDSALRVAIWCGPTRTARAPSSVVPT